MDVERVLRARMKILVLMDISVTRFYGYIEIYPKILVDILIQNIDT